jgi:hypothetical protein
VQSRSPIQVSKRVAGNPTSPRRNSSTELALAPQPSRHFLLALYHQNYFLAAYQHCVSRPASYSPYHYLDHDFCAHKHCCPSEDPPRATIHSGTLPRDLVDWTRSSSVRWLFDTRGTDSERLICCAGERGEPGETTTLSIESLLRCEVIPAHPYPPALAQLHRRLYYCTLRTGRTIRHCSCPTVTRHSSHRLDRTILFAVTATRART